MTDRGRRFRNLSRAPLGTGGPSRGPRDGTTGGPASGSGDLFSHFGVEIDPAPSDPLPAIQAAVGCPRCGWYRAPGLACPLCGAPP
jgi:hypothetical protein